MHDTPMFYAQQKAAEIIHNLLAIDWRDVRLTAIVLNLEDFGLDVLRDALEATVKEAKETLELVDKYCK